MALTQMQMLAQNQRQKNHLTKYSGRNNGYHAREIRTS